MKHLHFTSIDSTNTWAKAHVDQWIDHELTLVTAFEQTGGRGRFNRKWISPPDLNIYATFCFLVDAQRTDLGHIPQLLALTAAQLLEKWDFEPKIKWPNDLLLNGRKVAGILCESILLEEKRGIIVGIGLNVNMPKHELEKIDRPATSLYAESSQLFSLSILIQALKNGFENNLKQFIRVGFDHFWELFRSRSYFKKGDPITFHDNQNKIDGTFDCLHPDGSVQLLLPNSKTKIYYAGEFLLNDNQSL